ncbi:MAG TPA: type III-A CRISPR-associated protein Csm2 [Exilispira sp.]|nr:type III-A CRISPR-associated protein Csm2 [Exilispira sp.]
MSSQNRYNQNTYQHQNQNQPFHEEQFPGYYKGEDINLDLFNMAEKKVRDYRGLSTSQLRNIYNEVKNIEKRLKAKASDNVIMTRVKLLKAKVRYNSGRSQNALNKNFARDLEVWIDNIKNIKDFKAFCLLFEALVGYFYGFNSENQFRR